MLFGTPITVGSPAQLQNEGRGLRRGEVDLAGMRRPAGGLSAAEAAFSAKQEVRSSTDFWEYSRDFAELTTILKGKTMRKCHLESY